MVPPGYLTFGDIRNGQVEQQNQDFCMNFSKKSDAIQKVLPESWFSHKILVHSDFMRVLV